MELTAYFEYYAEIKKIIYAINAVEGYHRMVRKFTKSKNYFSDRRFHTQGNIYECKRNI